MTTVSPAAGYAQPPGSTDQPGGPPLTLPDQHLLLLWQVAARAEDLLAAAAHGRWPGTELAALADCARAGVLRQASDEETLLFQAGAPAVADRLARDHARLRSGAELLARAAAGEQSLSRAQLAAATRDFVAQLQRHVNAEEGLLASGRSPESVPATVLLSGHPHEWYPLSGGPVIDLDALPAGRAVTAALARLMRLRRGEQVEFRSGTDISPVRREMDKLSPGGYGFVSLQDGPDRWRIQVTRRY
ncbi:MAG: hemerythrin domain-containing protein [Streptosporangiaceae bacterium]